MLSRILPVVALHILLAGEAAAQPYIRQPGTTRPAETSAAPMIGLSAHHGLEVGGKVDFQLANPGFIPILNNTVFIEGGLFVAQRNGLFVSPALRWDFHIHPQWTMFGVGGLEANLNADDEDEDVALQIAAGAIWRMPGNKGYFIRGEVDAAHAAARIGPVFPL